MQMTEKKDKKDESIVYSILRMSQKALIFVLCLIGVGYIGGMIAIGFDPSMSEPLAAYTQIFIPLFQLEIGVYGLGSTLENVQKIRANISAINNTTDKKENGDDESSNG